VVKPSSEAVFPNPVPVSGFSFRFNEFECDTTKGANRRYGDTANGSARRRQGYVGQASFALPILRSDLNIQNLRMMSQCWQSYSSYF
jgi:hypothetical protein